MSHLKVEVEDQEVDWFDIPWRERTLVEKVLFFLVMTGTLALVLVLLVVAIGLVLAFLVWSLLMLSIASGMLSDLMSIVELLVQ